MLIVFFVFWDGYNLGRIVWIYSLVKEDLFWIDDYDKLYVKKYYEKGWYK